MAGSQYNISKDQSIDWINDTIKAILVMSNTTADTDIDSDTVSAVGTLDESDDGGYTRQALANTTKTVNDTDDRAEFDADDIVFDGMNGGATRDYVGVLVYKEITDDTDSPPLAYVPFGETKPGSATKLTVSWDGNGVWQNTT